MELIGRREQQKKLRYCLSLPSTQFLVVYGRRRVGKTYLINKFFANQYSFFSTGISKKSLSDKLNAFHASLLEYGDSDLKRPANWFEAFLRLKNILERDDVYRDIKYNKRVIFLDELPWFDSPRSDFKSAFDFFYNSYISRHDDILLIVCGSATTWILENLINDEGGFHDRVTSLMYVPPFTLKECKTLLERNGNNVTTNNFVIDAYLIFGGIPHYLNLINPNYSLMENVQLLCFNRNGELYNEFDNVFKSLFKNHEVHTSIIKALSTKKTGLTRSEIIKESKLSSGMDLTNALNELEQCGFIRKYQNYFKNKKDFIYQIIDSFTLFALRYLCERTFSSWLNHISSPEYNNFKGYSFEILCLNESSLIKEALGISGIESMEYALSIACENVKTQIDLIIDRSDNTINLCEIKYSNSYLEINKKMEDSMLRRIEIFTSIDKSKKNIQPVLISSNGIKNESHSNVFHKIINISDLI